MQRLFLLAWSAVVIVVVAIMGIVTVSLIPHFQQIGLVATIALFITLGCGVSLLVAFTWYKIKSMRLHSQFVMHGEIMVLIRADGQADVLSAVHEAAKVPAQPQVTVKELPSPDPRWDAVMDLRATGMGMQKIAKELKVPYNKVRDFLNRIEQNESDD